MSICGKFIEPAKAKLPTVKPKPALNPEKHPLLIFILRKEDHAAYLKESGRDFVPNGEGTYGGNVIVMREKLVPFAYRLDSDQQWVHEHYYERCGHIPGTTTYYVDEQGRSLVDGKYLKKGEGTPQAVKNSDAAQQCHCHELGHTFMRWQHDEGHAVMDGPTDGSREPVGSRGTMADTHKLAKRQIEIAPTIEIHYWKPGMGIPAEIAKVHPRAVTGRKAFK